MYYFKKSNWIKSTLFWWLWCFHLFNLIHQWKEFIWFFQLWYKKEVGNRSFILLQTAQARNRWLKGWQATGRRSNLKERAMKKGIFCIHTFLIILFSLVLITGTYTRPLFKEAKKKIIARGYCINTKLLFGIYSVLEDELQPWLFILRKVILVMKCRI